MFWILYSLIANLLVKEINERMINHEFTDDL